MGLAEALKIFQRKYTLRYPQFTFEIDELQDRLIVSSGRSFNLTLMYYNNNDDKLYFYNATPITVQYEESLDEDTILLGTIDGFDIDYYNLTEKQIDHIVNYTFTDILRKEMSKLEDLKKDFE